MIINHNMGAMNANRQMGVNSTNANKSMEKLSSGLRINKAGDDAAGLAISEKMRGQIRGLDQASANAQDGISMIGTAEGALNETTSILQRMRELAVQGSNDTNTTDDRTQIQKEMNQLTSEISRIGNNTEFNTQKLLKGGAGDRGGAVESINNVAGNAGNAGGIKGTTTLTIATKLVDGDTISVGGETITTYADDAARTAANSGSGDAYGVLATDTADDQAAAIRSMTFTGITVSGSGADAILSQSVNGTGDAKEADVVGVNGGSVTLKDTLVGVAAIEEKTGSTTSTLSTSLKSGDTLAIGGQTITSYADEAARTAANDGAGDAYGILATDTANDQAAAIRAMTFDAGVTASGNGAGITLTQDVAGTGDVTEPVVTKAKEATTSFTFQIGANEGQQFTASISDMRAAALGLAGTGAGFTAVGAENDLSDVSINGEHALDISTADAATAAITILDAATATVSGERAKLGAYSNRLEHTIANLGTSSENLTSAESRIRDVNMAKEMSTFSKNNILNQAAQAMLAQANQQPQQVLSLLR